MDKALESAKGNSSVQGVMPLLLLNLDELPEELRMIALSKQPKDDVAPPGYIFVDLCIHQKDMEAFKGQYKGLGSASVAARAWDRWKNLGYDKGTTLMCIGGQKAEYPGKSLYALGRSWFKEGWLTTNDKAPDADCIISVPKGDDKEKEKIKDDDKDALAAKELLRDFVMQAKTRASIAKMKGKKVQKVVRRALIRTRANEAEKEVRLGPNPANKVKKVTFAPTPPPPHHGKGIRTKRFFPKMRSMKEIMATTERMPDIFE